LEGTWQASDGLKDARFEDFRAMKIEAEFYRLVTLCLIALGYQLFRDNNAYKFRVNMEAVQSSEKLVP
jgi:hypothetical protein